MSNAQWLPSQADMTSEQIFLSPEKDGIASPSMKRLGLGRLTHQMLRPFVRKIEMTRQKNPVVPCGFRSCRRVREPGERVHVRALAPEIARQEHPPVLGQNAGRDRNSHQRGNREFHLHGIFSFIIRQKAGRSV